MQLARRMLRRNLNAACCMCSRTRAQRRGHRTTSPTPKRACRLARRSRALSGFTSATPRTVRISSSEHDRARSSHSEVGRRWSGCRRVQSLSRLEVASARVCSCASLRRIEFAVALRLESPSCALEFVLTSSFRISVILRAFGLASSLDPFAFSVERVCLRRDIVLRPVFHVQRVS